MPQGRTALRLIVLVLLTLAAYWPATRAGFIWDDDDYLTKNPTLEDAGGLRRIWLEPGAVPQYYPLFHTTFWIERHLWGLRPAGYHLVNILFHTLGALLLWRVLERLRVPGAWLAAGIFALHPLQVDSVAWITERKNVLSGAFFFAAILTWLRFAPPEESSPSPGASDRPSRRGFYILSLALFLCALLSKTATATLPAVLLLIAWWKRGRLLRREILGLLPFFALALLMGGLTASMERGRVGATGADWDLSFLSRILIAGRILWFYLGKLLCPAGLVFVYPRWTIDTHSLSQLLFPLAALAAGTGLVLGQKRWGRAPVAAMLYFAIALFPALGFFNVYWMRYSYVADHFQYLAGPGPIALLAGAATAWTWRRGSLPNPAGVWLRRAGPWAGLLVLGILWVLTFRQSQTYVDQEALWLHTLDKNPGAWMAHHNLARIYDSEGKSDLAITHYEQALRFRPDEEITLYNLASVLGKSGHLDEAAERYEEALRIEPNRAESHNNLGNVLFQMGRRDEAIQHFRRALESSPDYAAAHRNLAYALADRGEIGEAMTHLRTALKLEPGDAGTWNRLAWLLAMAPDSSLREGAEAVSLAEQAVRLTDSRNPAYLGTLAAAYAETGRYDQAIDAIQRAIQLASTLGRTDMAAGFRNHLEVYKTHRPLRLVEEVAP